MVYVASRVAATMLGLNASTLRRYADQGKIPHYRNAGGQRLYDVDADVRGATPAQLVAYCRVSSSKQRADLSRQVAHMRELYPDTEVVTDIGGGLNWRRKGLLSILERLHRGDNSHLWLPTGTASPASPLNSSSGWSSKTAAASWFSTVRMPAPRPNSPRIYSPSSIRSVAACTASDATARQSRRIRVYPNQDQKLQIATWLEARRWSYNLTVEILQSGIPAVWKHIAGMVMAELKVLHPEWGTVRYQVKRTAVRDACRTMNNVKLFNLELKQAQARGERQDEEPAVLGFRSRKNPRQSCYIPDDDAAEQGVYHTILGRCAWPRPYRRGKRNADW